MESLEKKPAELIPNAEAGAEDFAEQVAKAKEMLANLSGFAGQNIVGAAALAEVEGQSVELNEVLSTIPVWLRMSEGLPFSAAELAAEREPVNDEQYQVAA